MAGRAGSRSSEREAGAVYRCVRVLPAFEGLEQDAGAGWGLIPVGARRGSCDRGLRSTNISVDLRGV